MVFRWRSLCCLLRHATWLLRSVPLLPSLVYSPLYVACGMTESHRAHHVRCTGGVQVLALITMMGWKLGMIESVSLTILAGFSVDFCVRGFHGALLGIPKRVLSVDHFQVHLAHSYHASRESTRCVSMLRVQVRRSMLPRTNSRDGWPPPYRAGKTREAFTNMGVSVMSGMVTSVAGVCSMVCNSLVVEHGIDGVVALQHPCHCSSPRWCSSRSLAAFSRRRSCSVGCGPTCSSCRACARLAPWVPSSGVGWCVARGDQAALWSTLWPASCVLASRRS